MKISEIILPIMAVTAPSSAPSSGAASSLAGLHEKHAAESAVSDPDTGKLPTCSEIAKKLKRNKSLEIARDVFGFDPSESLTCGAIAVSLARRMLTEWQSRSGNLKGTEKGSDAKRTPSIGQTEAYWGVDLWGRALALEALVSMMTGFLDSEHLGALSAAAVKARCGTIILGADELLKLMIAGGVADERLKKGVDAAIAQVKTLSPQIPQAKEAIVNYVRG